MNVTDEVCRARCDAARYAGEAQGRADERAAVVAWLLTDAPGLADIRAHIAALIRTGSHVDAAKEKP